MLAITQGSPAFRAVILSFSLATLSACTHTQTKRPEPASDEVVIARAFMSNQACPSDPDRGQSESALAAAAISWLVSKGAELAVNHVANAVSEAAREDRETFTVTGQNTDYLYSVADAKPKLRQCLYVVVAPNNGDWKWCSLKEPGNWFSSTRCQPQVKEIVDRWKQWRLGAPLVYAEIGFQVPEEGPDNVLRPILHRLYYPKPISNIPSEKVKGLTLMVSATKPTKSNRVSGDVVMEVFIGGDGLTPNKIVDTNNPWADGLWMAVPSSEGKLGSEFAVPVNLTVTFAETPNPTPWLQAVAKFVEANKQKAVDAIVERVDPAKREASQIAEETNDLQLDVTAAGACTKLSTALDTVQEKHTEYHAPTGRPEEKLRQRYALDSACASARLEFMTATNAWNAAGLSGDFCRRSSPVDSTLLPLCN